jgi:hypothetical protein
MDREHLIIIALILVALYMMNKDTNTDTVQAMGRVGPMGRIRYADAPGPEIKGPLDGGEPFAMPNRVRYSDKSFAHSQHIKNHIRHGNRNASFKGLMEGDCGSEPFRFTTCSTNEGCETSPGGCCF